MANPLKNYTPGQLGLDLVHTPIEVDPSSLTLAQNIEIPRAQGVTGIASRGSLTPLNAVALAGSVQAVAPVPLPSPVDTAVINTVSVTTDTGSSTSADGGTTFTVTPTGGVTDGSGNSVGVPSADNGSSVPSAVGSTATGGSSTGDTNPANADSIIFIGRYISSANATYIIKLSAAGVGSVLAIVTGHASSLCILNDKVYVASRTSQFTGSDTFDVSNAPAGGVLTGIITEIDVVGGGTRQIGQTFNDGSGGGLAPSGSTAQNAKGHAPAVVTANAATGLVYVSAGAYQVTGNVAPDTFVVSEMWVIEPIAGTTWLSTGWVQTNITGPGNANTGIVAIRTSRSSSGDYGAPGAVSVPARLNAGAANPNGPVHIVASATLFTNAFGLNDSPFLQGAYIVTAGGTDFVINANSAKAVTIDAALVNAGVAWWSSAIAFNSLTFICFATAAALGGVASIARIYTVGVNTSTGNFVVTFDKDVIATYGGSVVPGQPFVKGSDLFWPFPGTPGHEADGFILKRDTGGVWTQITTAGRGSSLVGGATTVTLPA